MKKIFLFFSFIAFSGYFFYANAEINQGVRVSVQKTKLSTFSLKVEADKGIQDWLIFPINDYLNSKRGTFSGLPAGDGINCAKSFEREAVFSEDAFPLRITLQTCGGKDNGNYWGHNEKTLAFTVNSPGEAVSNIPFGSAGFITPLLNERVPAAVKQCVKNAPDGAAMFNDWQRWTANPQNLLRYGFTLETREIINMCAWQQGGVENPFIRPADGEPPLLSIKQIEIVFPVPELGNCASESECRSYCASGNDSARMKSCLNFAKNHGLLNDEEISRGEKFADILEKGGPGECRSETECRSYCDDVANIDVCLDFAESHNLIPADALKEARQVQLALKSGKNLPGGCKNKKDCEAYCTNPAHMRSCIDFAKNAGLLSKQELAEAEKFLPFIENGETPGKCRSKTECEAYCGQAGHFDECLSFGEKAGLISSREAEAVRKSGGQTPGGCKSKEQCEAYCSHPDHLAECAEFAQKAGLYTAEEFEQVKKEKAGQVLVDIEKKIDSCIAQSCVTAVACLLDLEKNSQQQGIGGRELLTENLKGKIDAKIQACQAELQPQNNEDEKPAGQTPSVSMPLPSLGSDGLYKLNQEQCQLFAVAPKCDFVGSSDSQAYKYCKQCFPDK